MQKGIYTGLFIGVLFLFSTAMKNDQLETESKIISDSDGTSTEISMTINDNITDVQEGKTVTVEPDSVVEIMASGTELAYDVIEIRAKAGSEITIRFINSSMMPHNVVLVKTGDDINPVGIAALQAYNNEYIPENEMDRILAYTSLAVPESQTEVTFTVPEPGVYPYICTYPGHFTSMQGILVSTE